MDPKNLDAELLIGEWTTDSYDVSDGGTYSLQAGRKGWKVTYSVGTRTVCQRLFATERQARDFLDAELTRDRRPAFGVG